MYNKFLKMKRFGSKYERYVQQYLEQEHSMVFMPRPANIKEYDMITVDGVKIEVKTDNNAAQTKKLFFEIYSNYSKNKIGWTFTYKADIICFVIMDKQLHKPRQFIFYDFRAIQSYLFEKYILDEDSYMYFVPKKGNAQNMNLLINIEELEQFRLHHYDYFNPDFA